MKIGYKEMAFRVYNRLGDAAGETGMLIDMQPDYAEAYGMEPFVESLKSSGNRDVSGTVADELFNQNSFWDMARDWIHDEVITQANVNYMEDKESFMFHYNKVCDELASIAPFMRSLILSWKE
jgi:hypothetical protein